jgi:hypothetical protein
MSLVRRHIKALDTDGQSRRAYIHKNIEQILADAHGMLMAEWSWYRSQVLRAGHISRDEANAVENERLLAEVVPETEREHTRAMDDVADLLAGLERQCRLIAELPGERSLPFTTKRRNISDAVGMAAALAERVAELRNVALTSPLRLTTYSPGTGSAGDSVTVSCSFAFRWSSQPATPTACAGPELEEEPPRRTNVQPEGCGL